MLEPQQYGNLLAQKTGATPHYYAYDGLGSADRLTDGSGNVTDTYAYSGYGIQQLPPGPTANSFQFVGRVGYYGDALTGLDYVRARYYVPLLARWQARDPLFARLGLGSFTKQISMAYGYVDNNPINRVDPTGLVWYTADLVAKSFINGVGVVGAIVPDRLGGPLPIDPYWASLLWQVGTVIATATDRLGVLAAFVSQLGAFNQNPLTDVKDGIYRLYSRINVCYNCVGNTITAFTSTTDSDGGKEGPGVYGTMNLSDTNFTGTPIIKKTGNTIIVTWSGWGRPNVVVEPGMQWVALRRSLNIWHLAEVWLTCAGGKGYHQVVSFRGSRFPSHRLWVNDGKPERFIPQGPLRPFGTQRVIRPWWPDEKNRCYSAVWLGVPRLSTFYWHEKVQSTGLCCNNSVRAHCDSDCKANGRAIPNCGSFCY